MEHIFLTAVYTMIWIQLLLLMLHKRHTNIWLTKSGQITVSGIYSVSTVCLPSIVAPYSHYTSIHMKCAIIGASKTNYVSSTININILEGPKHLHIIFLKLILTASNL
jgi:hypothetical protein